ncbi:MAG: MOSC domain-containing protein [Microthrixaceae bacterium]
MHLDAIWRYPVKSMIGEPIGSAMLQTEGLLGDRGWATRDEVRGGIRGAKKIGGLMRFAARYESEPTPDAPVKAVTITLPDGTEVSSTDPSVAAVVSGALDHEVTLWPLQPPEDLDHYRRGAPDHDDLLEEVRDIFGRESDEPLPDFSMFPPEVIEFESPPGTYLDAYPILVMTTAAFDALSQALPDSVIDVKRFRPNLVIDAGDSTGHPELNWTGRTLAVGEVELEMVNACQRCVMITREVDDSIPVDRAVLRHVVRDLDQLVGMYATVSSPGTVCTGDPVELR